MQERARFGSSRRSLPELKSYCGPDCRGIGGLYYAGPGESCAAGDDCVSCASFGDDADGHDVGDRRCRDGVRAVSLALRNLSKRLQAESLAW